MLFSACHSSRIGVFIDFLELIPGRRNAVHEFDRREFVRIRIHTDRIGNGRDHTDRVRGDLTCTARPQLRAAGRKAQPITGARKKQILKEGSAEERVATLVSALQKDGYDFTEGIDIDTPITKAERVVSAGKGIGSKDNMKLIEDLAKAAGAAIGSSRPVAETLRYVPLDRYVGMSGQKFLGNLYIACGISGAMQHLKGIRDASTIVAINKNANAPIFKNCDYGIVGDVNEILPLLTKALDTGEKKPIKKSVKIKRATPKKMKPPYSYFVCDGCGYEYDAAKGDAASEIAAGTLFAKLPEDWVCPECAEPKENFTEVL